MKFLASLVLLVGFLGLVGFVGYVCSATYGGLRPSRELQHPSDKDRGNLTLADDLLLEKMEREASAVFTYRYFQLIYDVDFNLYMAYLKNYIKILRSSNLHDRLAQGALEHLQKLLFFVNLGKTSYQDNLPASSPWNIIDQSRSRRIAYLHDLKLKRMLMQADRKLKYSKASLQQSSPMASQSERELIFIDFLLSDLEKGEEENVRDERPLIDRTPADLEFFAEKYNNHDTTAFVTYVTNLTKTFVWLLQNSTPRPSEVQDRFQRMLVLFSLLFPVQPLDHVTDAFDRPAAMEYLQGLKGQLERFDLTNQERHSEHEIIAETLRQMNEVRSDTVRNK